MDDSEFTDLLESMKRNGQLEPIVTYEGRILDGRHRYKACNLLELEPRLKELETGTDPVEFTNSMNVARRHLTISERSAMAAEEIERGAILSNGHGERATEVAAKKFGVSPRSVATARKVRKASPQKAKEVLNGKKTLRKAEQEVDAATTKLKDVQEDVAERQAMQDDALDNQDWVATLPLFGRLTGRQQDLFRSEAEFWREIQEKIGPLKRAISGRTKGYKRTGPYTYSMRRAVSIESPSQWMLCPVVEHGGCHGSGMKNGLKCDVCDGFGFRIPS
jgi:ParB-like chromosome segregation protein Spo0J